LKPYLRSVLSRKILDCHIALLNGDSPKFEAAIESLMSLSSSAIEVALLDFQQMKDSSLGMEMFCSLICCLLVQISRGSNFEFLQALLFRILVNFESIIIDSPETIQLIRHLISSLTKQSSIFQVLVEANSCLLRLAIGFDTA